MPQPWLSWTVASRDRHRPITMLAVGGLIVTGGLAVFGLPAVDLHGPLHQLGVMDPFCGGTRAVRLTMLGQWAAAWTYNPAGIIAVVGAVVLLVRFVVGSIGGSWVDISWGWTPRRRRAVILVAAAALVLLEIRQQGRADLLRLR